MASIRQRKGKWQVQVRRKGQPARCRSFHHKKDAQVWAREMELKADRQELPEDPKLLDGVTLGDLVRRYRDTVTPRKRGQEIETIVLNAFLRHPICSKRLSELQTSDFAAYRDHRLKHIKPSTLRRELSPLHNLFEVARDEWGLPIKHNPLDKVRLPNGNTRRERRLREGELERLIEAARKRRNLYVLPIILFALETAMRRGEIIAMQWGHVNLEDPSLLIPESKNGYARTIPLTSRAVSILREVGEMEKKEGIGISNGILYTDSYNSRYTSEYSSSISNQSIFPISANAFRLAWERVKKRAGIDDLHFHDLRHEAISRFFEMGLNAPEVALISGHRDMRMLFRYTHPIRQIVLRKLGETSQK